MLKLEARNVSLHHGAATVVSNVSLTLHAGEMLALVGPNGAGKSSLLSMLSGEVSPCSGTVFLNGNPLTEWSRRNLARMRSVVPQNTRLDFAFQVLEVVLMGRLPHLRGGVERTEDYRIAFAALERVQALELAHRLYPTLSGGERQRVQIARALAQIDMADADDEQSGNGRLLLLDEHTANLDPFHQHSMFHLMREIARDQTAVLAIVHDLNMAVAYADRIGVLDHGQLITCGPPQTVLTPDVIQSVFGLSSSLTRNPLNGSLGLVTAPSEQSVQHACHAGGKI
ncbi:heme ABC transporter ATP-binding protein [Thalassospira xiamenensis]|uniref:heme ABC transporter ATP-binding protein n=1 Tax=Thalassospira xiamenensis TaxID=220697 RepID=UPI0007AA2966|nr:heme ABC transporter ATP-binding protein [Thalassospira xiamenensis]KZB56354.1 hypothetical protein AUP41_14740 [Thalassospira xiamenensis]MCK2167200.1 heme ABC transporter ATP-binding protein [Thalassospira xiamenensis]